MAEAEQNRSADNKPNSLQARAEELVRKKLDVLIAASTAEALAFKKATNTIPIVFVVESDPVADGLVESLARPGGNITGITTNVTEMAGKRLALIKEFVPKLVKVGVLWNPHRIQPPAKTGEKPDWRHEN
jgi:putative ABC transport system substrate-binding protein